MRAWTEATSAAAPFGRGRAKNRRTLQAPVGRRAGVLKTPRALIDACAMQIARRLPPAALTACLAISLALLVAPLHGHIDDTDAQLYQVLARQMAGASTWLEPGLQPGSLQPFREHLPFGFWPSVAVVRLF